MDIKKKSDYFTGLDRQWGFQENRYMKVGCLSALRTGRFYAPGDIPGTHFRAIMRAEGLF